ncbi:MAG: COX15/CtaA family protein [Gammaproteobacteria bacterium]
MNNSTESQRFRRIGTLTVCAVYFLILVGGIVRASGAGMGCPDWPTCFGQWIPPTDEAQLPNNYHEIYSGLGYAETDFNPVKTWTEYINRLVGVTIGLLIFLTVWFSRHYLKSDKSIFYLSLFTFFLVGFQGWLGAAVVASNLKPFMITLHMLLALLIVALLIYTITRAQRDHLAQLDLGERPESFNTLLMAAMGMTLIQVMMGTQIRETVDLIAHQYDYAQRNLWIEQLPLIFDVHRYFSLPILLINGWLAWGLWRSTRLGNPLLTAAVALMTLVVAAIGIGLALDKLQMPAYAQPLHLLTANLIFGVQFFIYIVTQTTPATLNLAPSDNMDWDDHL